MKKLSVILLTLLAYSSAFASHIVGGEMVYTYVGPGAAPNTTKYKITLVLFRDEHCIDCAVMPFNVYIGIFNNDNNNQYPGTGKYYDVSRTDEGDVPVTDQPPCIQNPPDLHYKYAEYSFTVDLPDNTKGYTAAYQTCCRVQGMSNVFNTSGTGGTGSTYMAVIPGAAQFASGEHNNSPQFARGISLVCQGKKFKLDFSAKDVDGDVLVYSFCEAYNGGYALSATNINPERPPYGPVPYNNGYDATTPMGKNVTIDAKTGIISGIAPSSGHYVICVCIQEYRRGVLIGTHRKDFIINVEQCEFAAASLLPEYLTCDGFKYSFANSGGPNNSIHSYYWQFTNLAGTFTITRTEEFPEVDFTSGGAGDYNIKLVVNRGEECSDSTTSVVKVYPGFFPDFTTVACTQSPKQFVDQTKTNYGTVNSWRWDFGDEGAAGDSSRLRNPSYTYSDIGTKKVTLVVTNSKGCESSITKDVEVREMVFAGRDTSVVVGQKLQLSATGGDTYLWNPSTDLSDPNIKDPYAVYDGSYDSIRYRANVSYVENGKICSDFADVNVKIFNTKPQVFVPTAFTPNGDGLNDILRPIAVGMTQIKYFRVYNRWGQLVFETSVNVKGWNGKLQDKDQQSGSYVWIVQGEDFTGKTFFTKGTVTLVR